MKKQGVNTTWVIKNSGEREPFSFEKLRRSLLRSGADTATVEMVVSDITPEIKNGMRTSAIYKHAFSLLKKTKYPVAIRYSLRRAVMELGPSGFPFEKYVAEILRRKGYAARTGVMLKGFCVSHEVDILMEKDNKHVFVECKFRNQPGAKVDIKVALYVHARFLDLTKGHDLNEIDSPKIHEGWLVTNTKLTADAIQYANCAGLTLIGWNYPEKGHLHDLILETGVHPLTFLTTLTTKEKADLLARGMVMCHDLKKNDSLLRTLGFSGERIKSIASEIDMVCQEFN
ncbi:MAG: restriction endonuclease [Candidatus Pacebacteria bacterium]|nr:restriction endonuclease [Candidatus Paceibacterota bacterium]